mmetsp:Transcript_1638/g.4921  ORF Transcript_1638/g.4921 Transcript_1638/m.4921 type:complete len:282 (-) Transcript_1638:198-1043(-)
MAFLPQCATVSRLRSGDACRSTTRLGEGAYCRHKYGRRRAKSIQMTSSDNSSGDVKDVCAIVLAGGVGKRMKSDRPKQFLDLQGKTVLERSLELFLTLREVSQVVVVLEESYRDTFSSYLKRTDKSFVFADPGKERQDSVYNGLQMAADSTRLICVHDAARPLVTHEEIKDVLRDAAEHGAAVLGVPCKATVKESEDGEFVLRTIERKRLWEVQTPQVVEKQLLIDGFSNVIKNNLEVTDDVSIIEQLGKPVKITVGQYTNIKITTPDDLIVADSILASRQ